MRVRGPARADARANGPEADLVEPEVLRGQDGGAARPPSQVRRHRLQPGAERQGGSGRPARHPDHCLGRAAAFRGEDARRAGGPRLSHRRRARRHRVGPAVPVAGALCAARPDPARRGPAPVRSPAAPGPDAGVRGRRRPARGRTPDEALLPRGDGAFASERDAARALRGSDSPTFAAANRIKPLNRRFQAVNGYVEVTRKDVFRRYPFALLEVFFLLLQQHPISKACAHPRSGSSGRTGTGSTTGSGPTFAPAASSSRSCASRGESTTSCDGCTAMESSAPICLSSTRWQDRCSTTCSTSIPSTSTPCSWSATSGCSPTPRVTTNSPTARISSRGCPSRSSSTLRGCSTTSPRGATAITPSSVPIWLASSALCTGSANTTPGWSRGWSGITC